MHMEDQKIREDARKIMDAALHAALPDTAVEKALAEMPDASGRLILVAAGKAAWQMAAAAYRILGERIDDGIVITKHGHAMGAIGNLTIREAGHPVRGLLQRHGSGPDHDGRIEGNGYSPVSAVRRRLGAV